MCVVRSYASYTNGHVMYDSDSGPQNEGDYECDAEGAPIKNPKTGMPKPPPVRRMVNHKKISYDDEVISHEKFNWYCAGIGFCFGCLFWSLCATLWGV